MGAFCGTNNSATEPDRTPNTGSKVDWEALKNDILELLTSNPDHDDGTYGPLLIRLAWHSSGTYDADTKTGGTANGATMRFSPEKDDPENAGLHVARDVLEPLKKKYPNVSYADLWVYAAYVFIEDSGGPSIKFEPGRVDKTAEHAIENGRLPQAEYGVTEETVNDIDEEGRICGWEKTSKHVKDVFYRMGLNSREAVALLCGGHVYGRCHTENSGYAGPWVEEPWKFSNEYAADLLDDDWQLVTNDSQVQGCPVHQEIRPNKGKKQYVGVQILPENAPDATDYPPGLYEITTTWVNVRNEADTKSKIIGQPKTGTKMMLDQVKVFGTAIRGHLDTGGWVSIIASGGAELFARVGELEKRENPPQEEWKTGEEFVNPPKPNQMMLITDMVCAWDPDFRPVLKEYAEDEDLLRKDFGNAFKKLTELGFKCFPEKYNAPPADE